MTSILFSTSAAVEGDPNHVEHQAARSSATAGVGTYDRKRECGPLPPPTIGDFDEEVDLPLHFAAGTRQTELLMPESDAIESDGLRASDVALIVHESEEPTLDDRPRDVRTPGQRP